MTGMAFKTRTGPERIGEPIGAKRTSADRHSF
jgi:hypothetical protein